MNKKGRNIAKIALGVSVFAAILAYVLDILISHSSPFKFLWIVLIISLTCLGTMIKLIVDDVKDVLCETEEKYQKDIVGAFDSEEKAKRKLLWAVYCFSRGKNEKSLQILKNLEPKCTVSGDFRAVLLFMALSYANLGQNMQAIYSYEKAVKTGYATSNIHNNLGHLYAKAGDTMQAHQNYDMAIYYDSTNVAAYHNKAQLCFKDGNLEMALDLSKKALEINSEYRPCLTLVAVIYSLQEKGEESIWAKGKAIEAGESPATIDRLIEYYKKPKEV